MEQIELQTTTREVLGKKVRFLRRQGIIPLHLFGHNVESIALQCDTAQFRKVLAKAGKTRLIDLKLDKTKKPRKVVVREIQRAPCTEELLHVDLYQVSMEEKIKLEIPVILVGQAPALKSKDNILSQELNSLNIECLPDQIPDNVQVDISSLAEADQAIRVKDLGLSDKITVINDPEVVVVRIGLRRKEEEVVKVVAEEVAEAAEAPEGAEAAAPPEGEGKAEKPKKEG